MARLRSVWFEQSGPIGHIRIERPHGTNAIHESLIGEIADQFGAAAERPSVEVIWIGGRSDMFLAGVDLPFFGRCLWTGDIDRILRFTRAAHALLDQIAACPKPVAAWIQGSALGGGLELALACHRLVASPAARFAFPESSLGLYPGMGGTQRTARRVGIGLAKWMIYTGLPVTAEMACQIGLIDAVAPTFEPSRWGRSVAGSRPDCPLVAQRSAGLEHFFATYRIDELLDPSFVLPSEPYLVRAVMQVRSKAPLALRLAEQIIDRGITLPLDQALQEEYAQLRTVFSSEDARTGLLAFGRPGRPQFVGR